MESKTLKPSSDLLGRKTCQFGAKRGENSVKSIPTQKKQQIEKNRLQLKLFSWYNNRNGSKGEQKDLNKADGFVDNSFFVNDLSPNFDWIPANSQKRIPDFNNKYTQ